MGDIGPRQSRFEVLPAEPAKPLTTEPAPATDVRPPADPAPADADAALR